MRFRRLSLDAYGPFTGTTLDLSRAAGNGLHLIYGPNEAGKSSALRAIRDLLFGIPERTGDAHVHPAPALRLSACIERDGDELGFVRRKKRKDSLSTLDDKPLEEARLVRFLNGLDWANFDRLFGLDHERLERAGREMLEGKGDIGEALFDAGASGRSVHRVKLALIEEAELLFKDRGKNAELNKLLAVYTEQKKRAKDAVHSPEKYEEQQERVRETRREAEARRAELAKLRADKEHLGKLKNVLSTVAERDRKSAERATLGSVPSLRRGAAERRDQLLSGIAEAERDVARLSRQLAEHQGKLARLPDASPILGMGKETIRALGTRIGRAEKDLEDLPKRQGQAAALREQIERELPRLGLGGDLESVAERSLSVADQARLQTLAGEFQGLRLKLESAEAELPDARAKVDGLLGALDQGKSARRVDRDALLPLELLERFDGELAQAEEAVEALAARLREAELERSALTHQLELLKGEQGVPSLALLAQARAERDTRLREAQELAADPKRKALELSLPLAALAQASSQADTLVDRLRTEAQRVADAEALQQQLDKWQRDQLRMVDAQRAAQATLDEVAGRWQRACGLLSAADLLPREAARLVEEEREGWREIGRNEQELARARAALVAVETRAQVAKQAIDHWRAEWKAASASLGLAEDARPEQALALLAALAELFAQRQKLADLQQRVSGIQRDIAQFAALVQQQTEAFAPELSTLSPPEAAERLLELHRQATDIAAERTNVQAHHARVTHDLEESRARLTAQQQALAELCREAGVSDAAALYELEQKVDRARALDLELTQLDARLAEICEGAEMAALIEEARRSDRGVIAAQLGELDDLIAAREEDGRELERELTRLHMGLEIYVGRDAADADQELKATVARMAQLSSAWVRHRLATVVLDRVVESYRERHQGPVLERASELFSRLTLGEYSRLQVGLEETRLECVKGESAKSLEELSSGTRFQLYLALKLASIEQYLRTAPPLPLVLDDVLMEWDEKRAKVALSVLAEFSEQVQILLFTHLRRDVDHASELADSRIFTHQLAPRSARPELGLTVT